MIAKVENNKRTKKDCISTKSRLWGWRDCLVNKTKNICLISSTHEEKLTACNPNSGEGQEDPWELLVSQSWLVTLVSDAGRWRWGSMRDFFSLSIRWTASEWLQPLASSHIIAHMNMHTHMHRYKNFLLQRILSEIGRQSTKWAIFANYISLKVCLQHMLKHLKF